MLLIIRLSISKNQVLRSSTGNLGRLHPVSKLKSSFKAGSVTPEGNKNQSIIKFKIQ